MELVLVKVRFSSHQLRLGGQFAAFTNLNDRLKRSPGLFDLTEPEERLPRQIVELGKGWVARGSPLLLRLDSFQGVFPAFQRDPALNPLQPHGRNHLLGIGRGRWFGDERREFSLRRARVPIS